MGHQKYERADGADRGFSSERGAYARLRQGGDPIYLQSTPVYQDQPSMQFRTQLREWMLELAGFTYEAKVYDVNAPSRTPLADVPHRAFADLPTDNVVLCYFVDYSNGDIDGADYVAVPRNAEELEEITRERLHRVKAVVRTGIAKVETYIGEDDKIAA